MSNWDLTGEALLAKVAPENFTQFPGNQAIQADGLRGDWTRDATNDLTSAPEVKPQDPGMNL